MEFTGIIKSISPIQTFQGQINRPAMQLQTVAVENADDEFPHIAVFEFRGERSIQSICANVGQRVTVSFNFDGFYSQKTAQFYNRLRAWRMTPA